MVVSEAQLEARIQGLIDKGDLETATKELDKLLLLLESPRRLTALHELKARVLNALVPPNGKLIQIHLDHAKQEDETYEFLYADTSLVAGSVLMSEGRLQDALDGLEHMLKLIQLGQTPSRNVELFSNLIKTIKDKQKEMELEEAAKKEAATEKKALKNKKKKEKRRKKETAH